MKKTTAQLRNEAAQAAGQRCWSLAATLYAQALEAYPAHHAGSTLAARDKENLLQEQKSCEFMANQKTL